MEKEKKKKRDWLKKISKKAMAGILGGGLLLIIAIVCIVIFAPSGETSFSAETSLKEVFESSELSTSEYTYNSIAKVKIDSKKSAKEDNIKYYASYKGTVKSGFDFKKIDVVEKGNEIIVIIPKIEIQSVDINENLDYIFTKQKYNTEKTYQEAYKACYKDLESKAKSNKTLQKKAIENAIETVTALTKPIQKQLENEKTIKVVYIDDYNKEAK